MGRLHRESGFLGLTNCLATDPPKMALRNSEQSVLGELNRIKPTFTVFKRSKLQSLLEGKDQRLMLASNTRLKLRLVVSILLSIDFENENLALPVRAKPSQFR